MDRDPRINPYDGDIVRLLNGNERHVVNRVIDGIEPADVVYTPVSIQATHTCSYNRQCSIAAWKKWCRENSVEVIQVAK